MNRFRVTNTGISSSPSKSKTVTLNYFLMPAPGTISKNPNQQIQEKLKNNDLGPKNAPFTLFWVQEFSLNIKNSPSKSHYACRQVQFQKNLMNRVRDQLKRTDFGLKNDPFTPFRVK